MFPSPKISRYTVLVNTESLWSILQSLKLWFTRLPAQCHASACWIWNQPARNTKLRVLARERQKLTVAVARERFQSR